MTQIKLLLFALIFSHSAYSQLNTQHNTTSENENWRLYSIGTHLGQGPVNNGPHTLNYGPDLIGQKGKHLLMLETTHGVAWDFSIGDSSNKRGNYQSWTLSYGRSFPLLDRWDTDLFIGISHLTYRKPHLDPLNQTKTKGFGLPFTAMMRYRIYKNIHLGLRGQVHPSNAVSTANLGALISWSF